MAKGRSNSIGSHGIYEGCSLAGNHPVRPRGFQMNPAPERSHVDLGDGFLLEKRFEAGEFHELLPKYIFDGASLFTLAFERCAGKHISNADYFRTDWNLPDPFEIFRGHRIHVESCSFDLLRHFEVSPYSDLRRTILQGGHVELSRDQRGSNSRSINEPWRRDARATFSLHRTNLSAGDLEINNPVAH